MYHQERHALQCEPIPKELWKALEVAIQIILLYVTPFLTLVTIVVVVVVVVVTVALVVVVMAMRPHPDWRAIIQTLIVKVILPI